MMPRWTRSAIEDLAEARRYIERDDPDAAQLLASRILQAVDLLVEAPNMGRPGRVPATREFVVVGTRYLIVYRTRSQRLELLRILHQRRQWPPHG
jgi:plasmid stabilization system protein ParE